MLLPDRRKARRVATAASAARAGLGIAALLAPRAATAAWIGPSAARGPAGPVLGRALGGRDLALGAGIAFTELTGRFLAPWVLAASASDVVDALATLRAGAQLPPGRRRLVAAVSGGSALLAAYLSVQVDT